MAIDTVMSQLDDYSDFPAGVIDVMNNLRMLPDLGAAPPSALRGALPGLAGLSDPPAGKTFRPSTVVPRYGVPITAMSHPLTGG